MYNKRKIRTVISILIMLCFIEGIVLWNKDKPVLADDVGELIFSHESGFYEDDFELAISSTTGGTIYYTLDGSEPDLHSQVYNSPIHITDATQNENIYSMRTDVTAGFLEELVQEYSLDAGLYGYKTPDSKIDKATIVRAVIYYDNVNHSNVKTASYFVGFDQKDGYEGMNVLSIVTDPENLFDYEQGIYVTGAVFDNYWSNRDEDDFDERDNSWLWWSSNYRKSGREWEREASCQFFDETGKLVLSQNCGIRTHGGVSKGMYPRSLNLYAREEYGGTYRFMAPLFDNELLLSSVTLTQGGGDYKCKLNDWLFAELVKDLNISTMEFEPYVMFLDGEYWGTYWLTEKYDAEYVSDHYNVYGGNVVMIKNGGIEEGEAEDQELYEEMYYICANYDLTEPENYEIVCDLIDIESYIDYYAAMLYVSRSGDWPTGNYALWRTREQELGKYGDGKWRWMVFDLNSAGMTENLAQLDSIACAMEQDEMFRNMMSNDEFRQALIERIEELSVTVFDSERVSGLIDEHFALMEDSLRLDEKRFFGEVSPDGILYGIESVRGFFNERGTYLPDILDLYR